MGLPITQAAMVPRKGGARFGRSRQTPYRDLFGAGFEAGPRHRRVIRLHRHEVTRGRQFPDHGQQLRRLRGVIHPGGVGERGFRPDVQDGCALGGKRLRDALAEIVKTSSPSTRVRSGPVRFGTANEMVVSALSSMYPSETKEPTGLTIPARECFPSGYTKATWE